MFHKLLVLLKLLLLIHEAFSRNSCPTDVDINNCGCKNGFYGGEHYALFCPKPSPREQAKFTIKVKHNEIVHIECDFETATTLNAQTLNELPKFNNKYFHTLRLIWCPLELNTTLQDVIDALQINGIETIRFQNFRLNTMTEIRRNHFQNLTNINRLELTGVLNSAIIPGDVFEDLTNLQYLALNGNDNITFENAHIFDCLENLEVLDLSDNQFKVLPAKIFEKLDKLKSLSLRANQLVFDSVDDEQLFQNLNSLVELDLSYNNIAQPPINIFYKLINLKYLYLSNNSIKGLDSALFINNKKLVVLNLSRNFIEKIDDSLLKNLYNLQQLQIELCQLNEISANAFSSLRNVQNISLLGNQLMELPDRLFENTVNLRTLKLGYNQLTNLSDTIFGNLEKLEYLYIQENNLSRISSGLFQNLLNLKQLDLHSNQIYSIRLNAFVQNKKLEILNLSNNLLKFSLDSTPFGLIKSLKELDLSGNRIDKISNDWRISLLYLEKLILSHNRIKKLHGYLNFHFVAKKLTVDLQHNEISFVNMHNFVEATRFVLFEKKITDIKTHTIILSQNPLNCDCRMYEFFKFFRNDVDAKIKLKYNIVIDDLYCQNPVELRGKPASSIQLNEIFCSMESLGINTINNPCPKNCTCNYWSLTESLYVNCSHQHLKSLPDQVPKIFPNIILDVQHNELDNLVIDFNAKDTYKNISTLRASYNKIANVSLANWKGNTKMKILQLHANNLTTIDETILRSMLTIRNITLDHNPWVCTCDFVQYVRSDKRIASIGEIRCGDIIENGDHIGMPLIELPLDELCQIDVTIYIGVTLILFLICLLMSLIVVYYRHKMAIKIWLYQHNIHICFWFQEPEDDNKLYDAFVSYSHEDENFIVKELMPNLEQNKPHFRLCLHHRDWIPGEWIPDQIAFSVENSCRTIVVLSKHFLESVWGKMEFRVAHLKSIQERKARVIIIKYGDIGPVDNLDSELKAYLQLNTYIEWGTKDFWPRLRYALPHKMNLSDEGVILKRVIEKSLEHTQFNIEDTMKGNKIVRV